MTEVVLGLFQYSADPFLFGDVVVELVDMAFPLAPRARVQSRRVRVPLPPPGAPMLSPLACIYRS